MKRKIFSIFFALVLVLSFSLVTAVPASAAGTPTIDGTVSSGEWDGAVEIPVASGMGTVKLLASTDYLYVLFDVVDSGDHRDILVSGSGNDQISININPTAGVDTWGFPYDLIFETSALSDGVCGECPDDGGHHCLPWNPKVNSGNSDDGWSTRWFPNDAQETLPAELESATTYTGTERITEWKIPLASSVAPSPGDTLQLGGAIDVGDGNSYTYPVDLDWNNPSTFAEYSLIVENETTGLYYQTIQSAINVANTDDTINVAAGTYTENVVVDETLTLQGENRDTTEIKFGYGPYPSEPPLIISADGVTVSGFTIRSGPYIEKALGAPGGYAHTIIVTGDSALLTDLHVIKEPLLTYNDQPRIGGSAFLLTPGLDGFTLTDSTVVSEWNGIYAREDGSNIEVRNVDFTYPGEWAILLKMITGATIEENTFTCTADKYGVTVTRGSSGIGIVDNEFIGSGSLAGSHTGILLQAYATGTMGDVTILDNEISGFNTGILVEDVATSGISIQGNNITGNAAYGVNYLGSETIDATNNWWGFPTGPQHTSNPVGTGDIISDGITYAPWYIDEARTTLTPVYNVTSGTYHHSIQAGINAADLDDTISVAAGTYNENVVIEERLTLQGAGSGDDPASNTVIQSAVSGSPVIKITADGTSASERMTVKDLRVTGASGGSGNNNSGIEVDSVTQGYLTFDNVAATGSTGNGIAFDITAGLTDIKVVNCTLNNNGNAGLRIPTSTPGMSDVDITETKFNNNQSGMTIYSNMTNLTITNCKFNDNVGVPGAWQGGYGIYLGHWSAENNMTNVVVENSEFARNRNSNFGTGICVESEHGGTYTNVRFNYNNFIDNENYGVVNDASTTVDATYNWWSSANGPGADGANGVEGDVDYSPWLPGTWQTYYDPVTFAEINSDTDDFSDLEEYWLGTDPLDGTDFPGAAIDLDEVDTAYAEGDDPAEVTLKDSEGDPIADVDISGGGDASGTITGARYMEEPEEETGLSVGTGTTGVAFLDVKVTGYTEGVARITVPYPDEELEPAGGDGIVDGTDPPVDETTLSLYYWDDAAAMWRTADNNEVDTVGNNVSGDIPIEALTGTPVGIGGYLEDEALVTIESILNLNYSVLGAIGGTVNLTIDTNTAFLGAATIELTFDPTVVEVVAAENGAFDTLTVNTNYAHSGSDTQIARFVAHQEDAAGIDATEGVVVAVVKLNAVGSTMDESPLSLKVITLKDNEGDIIPSFLGDNDSIAIVGGIGDANRDGVVDVFDCVYSARAIAGFPGWSIDTPTMDVSGDDIVDAWDCTYLARHLVGLDYPLGG